MKILKDKPLRFALAVCVGYLAAVWAFNYKTYLGLGVAEAIQARYSYPILLLMFLLLAKSIRDVAPNQTIKAGLAVAVFPLFVWGGGITPWIIRADDAWRWQSPAIQRANHYVQTGLRFTVFH